MVPLQNWECLNVSDTGERTEAGALPGGAGVSRPVKVLLTDTNRWPVVPRLAIVFRNLGCSVAVLCRQPGHPVQKVRGLAASFPYRGYRPVESLKRAVEAFQPDIVVPACDRGVEHLHELHAWAQRQGEGGRAIAALIEYSLGATAAFGIVSSRHALLDLAHSLGIPVPHTVAIRDDADLETWQKMAPLPWVLKADGTWGGRGVRFADTEEEARRDHRLLAERASWGELAKRLILNRERSWTYMEWKRPCPGVIAQEVIEGRPANCAVVCWRGRVLAGIAVEVIRAQGPQGPATIVRVVPGREMLEAATKIAEKLGLSGFFGLDFMIESGSEKVYLIEMNPRCTPPCSLVLGAKSNLAAALWSQLTGRIAPATVPVTEKSTIAYYPQACATDDLSSDAILAASYLDVPAGEPELIEALRQPWSMRSLPGRILDGVRRNRSQTSAVAATLFEGALLHEEQAAAELTAGRSLA